MAKQMVSQTKPLGEKPLPQISTTPSRALAPRMKFFNHLLQIISVQMRVYLGGGNGLMTQHLLHGTQISPALDQMGGKRMSEGVRADTFLQADLLCK